MKPYTYWCIYLLMWMCECDICDNQIILKEERSIIITTKLNHLINVTAPRSSSGERSTKVLQVTKPNGDVIPLTTSMDHDQPENHNIKVKFKKRHLNKRSTIETEELNLLSRFIKKVTHINAFNEESRNGGKLVQMYEDVIEIGPLTEEDHGNWVAANIFKAEDGTIEETFKVFSVKIVENLAINPSHKNLNLGDTYKLRLQNNIPHLEMCEIIPPETTFDRYFERDPQHLHSCGFIVKNVTIEDQGVWKIIGVGNIVYEGEGVLNITSKLWYSWILRLVCGTASDKTCYTLKMFYSLL